jgi:hypothetical protein
MFEFIALGLLVVLALYVARRKPPQRYNLRNPVYGVPKNVKWQDGKPYTTE